MHKKKFICIRIPIRRYNSYISCTKRRNGTLAMEIRTIARAWCTPETYSRIWRKQVFFCVMRFIEFMNETSFVSSNRFFFCSYSYNVVASVILIKFDLHKLSMVALCVSTMTRREKTHLIKNMSMGSDLYK